MTKCSTRNDSKPLVSSREHAHVDVSSNDASNSPEMPHERDQRVGSTGGEPSSKVQQASKDLKRGLEDTSRAQEANQTYQQQKK